MNVARAGLFLRTIRYLTARQIVSRARRAVERRWWSLTGAKAPQPASWCLQKFEPLWRELPGGERMRERAHAVARGEFVFLNVAHSSPRWDDPELSQLWRYHLHYFDYLRELVALGSTAERQAAFAAFRALAISWIESNRTLRGDGWHPYTISLRMVNWCEASSFFRPEIDEDVDFAKRFYASLYGQAQFLSKHLEQDVRGNHLIKNLRALIWAGLFFAGDEPSHWLSKALRMLQEELAEQILDDGGHFERTPGYHVQVLRDLRETATLLTRNADLPEWLDETIMRMLHYLAAITPPSGRLPLLKDTTHEETPLPLLPSPQRSTYLSASGYMVVRNDAVGDFFIADVGKVCPDYLPAHAHADMFSFELTLGGRPVIVDSGVFEYARGKWRDWFRSTAAHNTVEIDGRNQSEVWDSFRVARRARPSLVTWREDGELVLMQGQHDGYAPMIHRRTIAAYRQRRMWVVIDELFGPARSARSFVHLHPDFAFEASGTTFSPFGAGSVASAEGWYSERFGEISPNRIIVLEAVTPVCFGYVISMERDIAVALHEQNGVRRVDVIAGSVRSAVLLPRDAAPRAS